MNIFVNDEKIMVESEATLASILSHLKPSRKLAVAVNDTVIQQLDWYTYRLQDNDRVLLIAPIQGG